ncbi:hypothetical protein MCEGEM3_00155 [Oxalobacteraceae bacterium]|jgi:hypothetical protein
MNPTYPHIRKPGLCIFVLLGALACAVLNSTAASLFGDLSCQSWADLDYPRKKTWTNAFLAPLSLTHQGLERTKPDRYNDDPKAVEPAIVSIDKFCLSHPKLSPADGAISYLHALIAN